TIAVGAISSYDDVNSLILAGRADLCALGRPHLYDPQWTLHAAVEQGYQGPGAVWPAQFAAGSRKPPTGRTDGPRPPPERVRDGRRATRARRWRPGGPACDSGAGSAADHARERLRATFGADAAAYHRARPGYPSPLFDDLAVFASVGPGALVLEIGCGTGQA